MVEVVVILVTRVPVPWLRTLTSWRCNFQTHINARVVSRAWGGSPIGGITQTDLHFYCVAYQYPRNESLFYRRNSKKVLDGCGVDRANRFSSIDGLSKPTSLRKAQAV